MSRFVALTTNENERIGCALAQFSDQVGFPPRGAGGWGLGHYRSGNLLQRIEPREEGESIDTFEVLESVKADLVIMHARAATVGKVKRENTHPFKFQQWSFAHNGTMEGFEEFREKVVSSMPPFILRGLDGDTDSEHLFHLFLSFLYDSGEINRPGIGIASIKHALARAISTFDEFAKAEGLDPSPMSAVVSDGYSLVVVARGIPVYYVLIEGIGTCSVCRSTIPIEEPTGVADHPELKAAIVVSGAEMGPLEGFQALDDKQILAVSMEHGVEYHRFDI